ncbi:hypothetical protein PMSD_00245 [Paenibacillus macquariensis subsp. defensor]|nr:hypothetical protein PMSD_00245 [Paenibacillus macquariensis subsp. defensor]
MVQKTVTGRKRVKISLIGMLCFAIIVSLFGPVTNNSQVFAAATEFSGGTGEVGNPFIITTPEQLDGIREKTASHYKLGGNIDLTDYLSNTGEGYNEGKYWIPILYFYGTLDGDGYVINGLRIKSSETYSGLFGSLSMGSSIKNIGLENVEVSGPGMFTGGLAGQLTNSSTVSNSYVTGNVKGMYTGGIVGYHNQGKIINSYSTANIESSSNNVGGLIGIEYRSSMTNSYAAGRVKGNYPSGGLVGGTYSGVDAGVDVDSFYDKEVSRQSDNSGKGIPKSTTEMKTKSTFTNWDFDTVWFIKAGQYPQLQVFLAETPTADIESGPVAYQSEVKLSSQTVGASVYYTTNGDEPTMSSARYSSPIVVTDDMTIKAIAAKGNTNNEVMIKSYTVTGRPAAPTEGRLLKGTNIGTTSLNGVTGAMEYKVNSGSYINITMGTTFVDNISIQEGDTISVRIKAKRNEPASNVHVLTVTQEDFNPKSTVSTLTSKIGTVSEGVTGNGTITNIPYGTTLADFKEAITPAADATFEVYEADGVKVAETLSTGNKVIVTAQDATTKTTYTVTMQAGPPTGNLSPGTNVGTTRLNGVTDLMEYTLNSVDYVAIATGATSADNINVQAGDKISVRTKATEDIMASAIQVLTVSLADIKPKSTVSTLTSKIGTVSEGVTGNGTITNIPYGTTLAAFKEAITPAADATFEVYKADGVKVAETLATDNKVIVTAQDTTMKTTYTVTMEAAPTPIPGAPFLQIASLGDAQVGLKWSPMDGSTAYTIYQSDTSAVVETEVGTVSGSVYGFDVTGLTNGTTYYFTVKGSNHQGDSPYSNIVSATPLKVSGVPSGVVATAGNGQATVSFTPPTDNGGSPITSYEITAYPGGQKVQGIASPLIVTGLTNGIMYTFTVKAINAAGSGAESTASNVITPRAPTSSSGGGGGSTSTPTATPTPTVPPVTPVPPTTKPFYNEKVNIDVIKALVENAKAAPAVTFKDVPASAPNAKTIELATKLGIIKGNADGRFHGNATITRAEFATMLVRALGLTSKGDSSFKDTKGHWAADTIAMLQASGIINGYVDGTFKPNQTITRAEIVAMLAKVMNTTLVKNDKFKDVSGNWAEAEIDTLSDMGIVKGAADGSFKPNANATRSESLVMILRMLNASLGHSLDVE